MFDTHVLVSLSFCLRPYGHITLRRQFPKITKVNVVSGHYIDRGPVGNTS